MSEIISSIYHYMEETGKKEGILFIDEINCVSETLAPTMLQFLQCKTFGNQAVPEGWIITAAGNPPEYNKSVREFDFVTLDRVVKLPSRPTLMSFAPMPVPGTSILSSSVIWNFALRIFIKWKTTWTACSSSLPVDGKI